jgi:HD-like signal output (HDOD) protein/prolyl-tRNA editing enzyme YbaK/EbsC (Cys-tRNA(Pro) deacylase)
MPHSTSVTSYLQRQDIPVEGIEHPHTDSLQQAALLCNVALEKVARAVLLGDEKGVLLAILPLSHVINFAKLYALAQRKLEPVDRSAAHYVFPGCESGSIPPLASPFGIQAIVDEALFEEDEVYIEPGSHELLLKLSGEDFARLHVKSLRGKFSNPAKELNAESNDFVTQSGYAEHHGVRQLRPIEAMRERIKQLTQLPPLSNMTLKLLELQKDPDATIAELARVVETDPSLTAQLMRHARSPYYGYPGKIETIDQAISQVLGFDTVINTALAISSLRPFEIPKEGALGLQPLWRHAVFSAMLAQLLCSQLPRNLDLKPDVAYLAGLLHNFGYLVLGHLLKPEYFLLNRVVSANPEVPITLIEKRTLGIGHTQIGSWLMHAWHMPKVLEVTLREHHNEFYQGEYAGYANLMLLVDTLLKPYGLGDANDETPPAPILNRLGLSLERAREITETLMQRAEELDNMAIALSA